MQIYGPSQIHGAQPINAPHAPRAHEASSIPASSSTGDRLDISEAGQIAGRLADVPEMRADRVQELRTAILEGSYETDAKLDIALDRLLDEIG
jgi:negative regulator of flagellin synthesis FlgM